MISVKGYGNECSLMIASRAAGISHHAPCSRIASSSITSKRARFGSLSKTRVSLQAGRLSKNPGEQSPLGVESIRQGRRRDRSPRSGLVGLKAANGAVALFDDGEAPQLRRPGINEFVSFDAASVEKKYFGGLRSMLANAGSSDACCWSVCARRHIAGPAVGPGTAAHSLRRDHFTAASAGARR